MAKDDEGRFWVYFGTGRFWSSLDRDASHFSYQNSFYGIKEPVDSDNKLTYDTVGAKATSLKNVTGIDVKTDRSVTGGTTPVVDQNGDSSTDFDDLLKEIDAKDGWFRDFSTDGERNLGQATILGGIVTFSTFIPNNDLCSPEGFSNLYALYYKTGTAYYEGVLLTDGNPSGTDSDDKVIYTTSAGKGYSTTPNIHTGAEEGSTAFLQTSTGAIKTIATKNTAPTTSGGVYWMEKMEE